MYTTAKKLGLVENFQNTNQEKKISSKDPAVWGPHFWFTLHTSALYYPLEPSKIVMNAIKNRIMAIPYELPCDVCRPHALAFIEKHYDNLDTIVSSRENLGKFYLDFHNHVNRRYGKPEWTYEKLINFYSYKNENN
jgi:hypothetical protein